ncbi:hypothetical protein [Ectothiorhodospira shaposhnikovii]|uniref:hypothetical protein n=1 Tax=Ectothiorhodospira shaposhnikovii TaxID=1054 RepID=UPI001EE8FF08|nr:hypothetical protein [Ectothiorhodospira shaposhnikovii]MCG5514364.1 hypothetical protein [Ectothiorhodospira shaposhnikovii]
MSGTSKQECDMFIDVELTNVAEKNLAEAGLSEVPAATPGDTARVNNLEMILLDRTLDMACQFKQEGKLEQAVDLYWQLLDEYPKSSQAARAVELLLELADFYEKTDCRHIALGIYERLRAWNSQS